MRIVEIAWNCFGSRRDWSQYLREWSGLVGISLGEGGIGQNSFGSGWDCSELLWEQGGLERFPITVEVFGLNLLGAGRIGQNPWEAEGIGQIPFWSERD